MILTIKQLEARASERPEGYVAEVISLGTLSPDGKTLDISREALAVLREKYRPGYDHPPHDGECRQCGQPHD